MYFYLLYTQKQLHKINFCKVTLLITFPIINGILKKMEKWNVVISKKWKKKKKSESFLVLIYDHDFCMKMFEYRFYTGVILNYANAEFKSKAY